MKVLVLFANPRGSSSLRLGEEDRKIQECIRRSKNRADIDLVINHAVTIEDVRRALLDDNFDIVHFSGHGTGTGLALEDESGRVYVPPRDAVADLIADFSPPLVCALLNACYSTSQGRLTSLGVPYTIAMEGPIADNAAIVFTGGFYDSLAAGKDVEFSYQQGIHALRLAGHPDSNVPILLKKGEFSSTQEGSARESKSPRVATSNGGRNLVLGIALDVSGSMERSIDNKAGTEQTRLEGFREALDRAARSAKDFLNSVKDEPSSSRVFAYAFGLRTDQQICDLFSLIQAAEGVVSEDEIESLKRRYSQEMTAQYSGASGLGALARSYGLGDLVTEAERAVRAGAERQVRDRILAEVGRRLMKRMKDIGEVTLRLDELADLWEESSSRLDNAGGLIFGNTPMCAALTRISERFSRELDQDPESVAPVLLLVSDGRPTDGDPVSIKRALDELGVTVVGCYITDTDILEPRTLYSEQDSSWPAGAQLLFQMASTVPADTAFQNYLLRQGWRVPPQARSFVQVNHSGLLEEIFGWAVSPIEEGYGLLPKGQ